MEALPSCWGTWLSAHLPTYAQHLRPHQHGLTCIPWGLWTGAFSGRASWAPHDFPALCSPVSFPSVATKKVSRHCLMSPEELNVRPPEAPGHKYFIIYLQQPSAVGVGITEWQRNIVVRPQEAGGRTGLWGPCPPHQREPRKPGDLTHLRPAS